MAMPLEERDDKREPYRPYLEWLRRKFEAVDHIGALAESSFERIDLQVLKVFVPQQVRREPPPVSLPRELWLRYLAHGKTTEHDVPDGIRRELLEQKLKEYADRPPCSVLDVLASERQVVLLGYPGAGKSMLARYVALSLADPAGLSGPSGPDGVPHPLAGLAQYVPFIATLRTYPEHESLSSFEEVIGALAGPTEESVSVTGVLQSLLRARGNALVIFDGLDEVFDLRLRNKLKEQIKEFAQTNSGARIIVTSRVTDYDRHKLDEAKFAHHTLQDLTSDEVSAFVHRFYGALYPANKPEATRLSTRLLGVVRQSPAIAELAGNPLLLTSIAFLGRAEEVPSNRIKALDRTVRLLADNWDATRGLPREHDTGPAGLVDLDEKLDLLRLVARRIMASAEGQQPRNYVSGDELKKLFTHFIAERYKRSQGDASSVARHLLGQFRDRDYILAKFDTDAYGFVHRSFLDYLAADDIRHQFAEREMEEADVVAKFQEHWNEPAWQEVLVLLAGLLRARRADRAIQELLAADPLWYLAPDPLPRHVLLAIRCLGEVRHHGETNQASRAVARTLISVFETVRDRSDFGAGVTVAQALERDALPVLAALPPDWDGWPLYEAWYLARGQFLRGERPGPAQGAAARLYTMSLGREDDARERLAALARWADSEALRVAATEALAAAWPDDTTTVLVRANATDDPDWYVRMGAARAVARNWPGQRTTRDLLVGLAIGDGSAKVRGTAVRLLADEWRDADLAAQLREVGGGTDDWSVRAVALRALAENWHDDPDTLAWLWRRVADGEHPRVRACAAEVLAEGWHDEPRTLAWLRVHAATDGDLHPEARVAALRALASGWPDRAETVELLKAAAASDNDDPRVRRAALETLAAGWRDKKRNANVARLLVDRASADPDDEVRYVATQAIATYWKDSATAVALLRRLAFGDAAGGGSGSEPHGDVDPFVRAAAAQALADICRGDEQTGARLRRLATEDDSWYVRQVTLGAVATGWHDDLARTWLRERAACDSSADVRGTAVEVLAMGWRQEPDPSFVACPAKAMDASDAPGGPWDIVSAQACRIATRVALAEHPAQGTYEKLLQRAQADQHPDTRKAALQFLASTPSWRDEPGTLAVLRDRALIDPDPDVREAAIWVISAVWHTVPETGAWLREYAFPGNEPLARLAVIRAVASEWHDDPKTQDWLRDHGAGDPNTKVRRAAILALRRGWPEPRADVWRERPTRARTPRAAGRARA